MVKTPGSTASGIAPSSFSSSGVCRQVVGARRPLSGFRLLPLASACFPGRGSSAEPRACVLMYVVVAVVFFFF